jgi:hypothetical protein
MHHIVASTSTPGSEREEEVENEDVNTPKPGTNSC